MDFYLNRENFVESSVQKYLHIINIALTAVVATTLEGIAMSLNSSKPCILENDKATVPFAGDIKTLETSDSALNGTKAVQVLLYSGIAVCALSIIISVLNICKAG